MQNICPKDLKDFRSVVVTSNIMKCLKCLVKNYICDNTNNLKQFAFCKNRSVQDASLILLNDVSKHLEKPKPQVRTLFVDFISAFNTVQPHLLLNKLFEIGLNSNILK